MPADGAELVARYNRRRQERANHDWRWERMAPHVAPSRVGIQSENMPGDVQTRGVFDSTTMMAAELHAMFIAGHIINPSQQWFHYKMRNPAMQNIDPINEWLEECRDITLQRVASSSFYAEGPEALIDYAGFGTGFLLCEEAPQPANRVIQGFRGFHFRAEKTGRFCIEEGADGLVDTAYREFKLSARIISDRWGKGANRQGGLPENVTKALQSGETSKEFKIIHCIYPRPTGQRGSGNLGMPWASVWIEFDSKTIIHESGYQTFAAAVPRYHKTPNEVYGRGRGDHAFPDTWTLNTAKRMSFEDWALKIRPPILHRHDSVIGSLKLVPGGPTAINTHGRPIGDAIQPFETGSRPEISQIKEEELRKSIRNIFYVEQILALLEVHKSEQTAFEFARKIELLFRLLGPVYGRLEWEWLYRIVDIMFIVQWEARAFPPPPPELFRTDGDITIEFQNPIAKAQRAGDAESLTLALNDLAPLANLFGPETLDRLDHDRAVDGILNTRGVPARWLRTDDEVAKIRTARAQAQQRELQMQDAAQIAESAGKAAPALKVLQERAGAAGGGAI